MTRGYRLMAMCRHLAVEQLQAVNAELAKAASAWKQRNGEFDRWGVPALTAPHTSYSGVQSAALATTLVVRPRIAYSLRSIHACSVMPTSYGIRNTLPLLLLGLLT